MANRATGTFDVKLTPQTDEGEPVVGRMTIDKQFNGDLEGTSKGQMIMASTAVQGSAGYVALERVEGSIFGKRGTFYLQHNGVMTRGVGDLSVAVLPDSGTDELLGLTGKMTININDGAHSYEFEYALPES